MTTSSPTTPPKAPDIQASKIRNILQTAKGNREVIKTAPDMVVYLDGFPFIIHPYMRDKKGQKVVINFNDYIMSVSTTYSTDALVPTGTISMSIPNGQKNMFKTPGGGLIIDTMSEVQIFAKSYFMSPKGNSVYRKIFNGMVKLVSYVETNTSLEISLNIVGILHWFELVSIGLKPGLMSNSSTQVVPYSTNQSALTPYDAIADTFTRQVDLSDALRTSIEETNLASSSSLVGQSIKANFVGKWEAKLSSIWRFIHIFGINNIKASAANQPTNANDPDSSTQNSIARPKKLIGPNLSNLEKDFIKRYTFDLGVTSVDLFSPTNTPRAERVRSIVDLIGYEAYQDIDGTIVIKPPLYNLDSTIIGSSDYDKYLVDENLSEETNPYIIHLSEVIGEGYAEDESAIRRTRMTLQGNWNVNGVQNVIQDQSITTVADAVDVNLVRKFGLRDAPPKTVLFLQNDKVYNYGFAWSELAKINLGYKTYNVTIPMRPELRLGFPIFLPHLDMYAYVHQVSISYNVGGRADMSLQCYACRKRLQFPVEAKDSKGQDIVVFESIPNLVHKYVKNPASASDSLLAIQNKSQPQAPPQGKPDTNSLSSKPSKGQKEIYNYLGKKLGWLYETFQSVEGANWRIQNDTKKVFDGNYNPGVFTEDQPAGKKIIFADYDYLNNLRAIQPYTDEKGYEVISPFPWGRYTSVKQAIYEMTRSNGLVSDGPSSASSPNVDSFLMANLASPSPATLDSVQSGATDDNTNYYAKQIEKMALLPSSKIISFEMDYSNSNMVNRDTDMFNNLQNLNTFAVGPQGYKTVPPDTNTKSAPKDVLSRVDAFLSSTNSTLNDASSDINSILNENPSFGGKNGNISTLPQTNDLGLSSQSQPLAGKKQMYISNYSDY